MSEPYIRIRDLVKHYATPSGFLPVLQGVDLDINQGDWIKVDTRTGQYVERVKK